MRLRGCQPNSSSASTVYNIVRLQNKKFCSWPKSSPLISSLYILLLMGFVLCLKLLITGFLS